MLRVFGNSCGSLNSRAIVQQFSVTTGKIISSHPNFKTTLTKCNNHLPLNLFCTLSSGNILKFSNVYLAEKISVGKPAKGLYVGISRYHKGLQVFNLFIFYWLCTIEIKLGQLPI